MKQRPIETIATLVVLFLALTIGPVQSSAQQPTPTLVPPSPVPTPTSDWEGRISKLEEKVQTIRSLELINDNNRAIMLGIGGLIAMLVIVQSFVTGIQLHREGRREARQARREDERDSIDRTGAEQVGKVMRVVQQTLESRRKTEEQAREFERSSVERVAQVMDVVQRTLENRLEIDRTGVEQVSKIMTVVRQTLESHLKTEEQARGKIEEAQGELEDSLRKFAPLQQFYQNFQNTIQRTREAIEKRASHWATTVSRHDFRKMTQDLDDFAQQLGRFETEFEELEEVQKGESPPRFSARVPYIRGIAAHYANQPEIAMRYLDKVVRCREPEPDEIELAHKRRIANAYYYIGLTESNFDNPRDAIEHFKRASELDPQNRDFLTRVVTAEAYVMMNDFIEAGKLIDQIETRLCEIERDEGRLRNFHLRLRSRAALIRANMAIIRRDDKWYQGAQQLLEEVHSGDAQYYYASATLAQIYYAKGKPEDMKRAQKLFGEAYIIIERSGHLLTVTEARSKVLLFMVAGMCCKHGLMEESRSDELLDKASGFLTNLPKIDSRVCTVFSPLSKRNEKSDTIRRHIESIRGDKVLL